MAILSSVLGELDTWGYCIKLWKWHKREDEYFSNRLRKKYNFIEAKSFYVPNEELKKKINKKTESLIKANQELQ